MATQPRREQIKSGSLGRVDWTNSGSNYNSGDHTVETKCAPLDLTVVVPAGVTGLLLTFSADVFNAADGGKCGVIIKEGSTYLGAGYMSAPSAANVINRITFSAYIANPTAGSHTYSIYTGNASGGGSTSFQHTNSTQNQTTSFSAQIV